MIALVNKDGSIKGRIWRCNKTGSTYEIIATSSTYNASHYRDNVMYSKSIVKREDGLKRTMTRTEIIDRFKDVMIIKQSKY